MATEIFVVVVVVVQHDVSDRDDAINDSQDLVYMGRTRESQTPGAHPRSVPKRRPGPGAKGVI